MVSLRDADDDPMNRADDEREADRRSGLRDRREDASAPAWKSSVWSIIFSVLVTILISLASVMISKLSSIESSVRETRDALIRQDEGLKRLRDDYSNLAGRVSTIERAYQYNLNTRLTYVEATLGIKKQGQTQDDNRGD